MRNYLLLTFLLSFFQLHAQIPISQWVNSHGGWANDYAKAMVSDDAGYIYLIGEFVDMVDFDPGSGTTSLTSNGGIDFFVQKLDSNGNMIWTKTFGGIFNEYAHGIAIDDNNDLVIVGSYVGTVDFDPGPGTLNPPSFGGDDVFVLKLSQNGNFVWVKTFGGILGDYAFSVAVDDFNDIYLTGSFRFSVDFDPGAGVDTLSNNGNSDIYVLKLSEIGSFEWVNGMGSDNWDRGSQIEVDDQNNVLIMGWFRDTVDFDTGPSIKNLVSNGADDVFVQKLDLNGATIWTRSFGGTENDNCYALATDRLNNVYTSGSFSGIVDFDPGTSVSTSASFGEGDIFLQKLDENGVLQWYNTFGDTSTDLGYSIAFDADDNILFGGEFHGSVDFSTGAGSNILNSVQFNDAFLQKLDQAGNQIWTYSIGGLSSDAIRFIHTDNQGAIYLLGSFGDTIDVAPGANQNMIYSKGSGDFFVQKLYDPGVALSIASDLVSETSVFPNPTNGMINIKGLEENFSRYEVVNPLGLSVLKGNFQSNQLDLSRLPKGSYFIRVYGQEGPRILPVIRD